eukprot:7884456-Ditylum_brightwellii.AAC.1
MNQKNDVALSCFAKKCGDYMRYTTLAVMLAIKPCNGRLPNEAYGIIGWTRKHFKPIDSSSKGKAFEVIQNLPSGKQSITTFCSVCYTRKE